MTNIALVAACALAVTFVVSSVSKLRDWPGFRQSVSDFGVPSALAPATAVVVACLEAAAAVALLAPRWWAVAGAITAGLLLLSFTAGIVVNLLRGRHPACNCFGRASQEPLSWRSVVRNVLLLALTALVLLAGPDRLPGLVPWLSDRSAAEAALLAGALVAATIAVSALLLGRHVSAELQEVRRDLRRGTSAGTEAVRAPRFSLPTVDGDQQSLNDLLTPGLPVLLFFMSPTCSPCRALAPDVRAWAAGSQGAVTLTVISDGDAAGNREEFGEGVRVLLQQGREVQDLYEIDGTPALVLLAPDGTRVFEPAYGADEIRALVADLSPEPEAAPHVHQIEPRPLSVGDPLPAVQVENLDGAPVDLPHDLPQDCVLLFWDTTCGFANGIRDDVLAWEAGADNGRLVVINRSDGEAVRDVGFRARILQDQAFRVGNAVGSPGTPSAVRVQEGVVVSAVAAGGPEVLALLREASASG